MSTAAERYYTRLAPVAYADADNGLALQKLTSALTTPEELVHALVRDSDTHIAWGTLLDPDACPLELLDWLAVFCGVPLPPSALSEAEKRYRIRLAAGLHRGTPRALVEEIQLALEDTKTVLLSWGAGDRWHYVVGTIDAETPDEDAVDRAIAAQKPAWMIPTRVLTSDWSWFVLAPMLVAHRAVVDGVDSYTLGQPDYPTWQSVVDAFDTWQDLLDNTPS